MTYSDKLKDPRWQKKRLEILNRDEFMCIHCGDEENTLHVHHTYYKPHSEPWEAENKWLITLCENCHKLEHETFEDLSCDLITMIKQAGYTSLSLRAMVSVFKDKNNL